MNEQPIGFSSYFSRFYPGYSTNEGPIGNTCILLKHFHTLFYSSKENFNFDILFLVPWIEQSVGALK